MVSPVIIPAVDGEICIDPFQFPPVDSRFLFAPLATALSINPVFKNVSPKEKFWRFRLILLSN